MKIWVVTLLCMGSFWLGMMISLCVVAVLRVGKEADQAIARCSREKQANPQMEFPRAIRA